MELERLVQLGKCPPTWYVIFGADPIGHWFDKLLHPGFKHVFAIGYVPDTKQWLIYDVALQRTRIATMSTAQVGGLIAWVTKNAVAVEYTPRTSQPSLLHRLGLWCVPAIKHLLGVRCVALTPYQLYWYLLRHGGKLVWEK